MTTNVLITTFNRAHLLKNSLERMTHLTLANSYTVVDDGSSDGTEEVVGSFNGRLPIRYIYNHNPKHSICSLARNIGIKNTDADIIITTEPEMIFVTDVVAQMLEHHKDNPNQVITAGTIYHGQSNTPSHPLLVTDTKEALNDSIIENYIIQPRSYRTDCYVKSEGLVASYIALYEKKWLEAIGGWDEDFPGIWGWDDHDLLTRLRINGINQDRANDIEAIHQYHGALPPHIQGEASRVNEKHFTDKNLNIVEQEILEKKRLG